ncbi:prenyltransferase, UbiA family [Bulleidia extructa W1219]|uniref:Prenyltransferase, UbiA family n=1 Tax=Bulleidia extructa W1219 TaxID=679192 RepID=D2MPU3_9FIRM|nr:decaprenyl-phosphate phosphoribosyltransferase [Bulleidia extructa]EFC05396.1 prenyltransferase, UbiA family [Bulleidia extructa W1219]
MERVRNYIKLMRLKHCVKNILILLPLVFSGELFQYGKLLSSALGFLAFSFLASAVYILNDIQDVEKDRLHPKKKFRPIASGKVSEKQGKVLSVVAMIGAITLNFLATTNYVSFIFLGIYLVMNIFYSKGLKNVPLLDIVVLASGFLLRLIYGGIVTNIHISNWLYLTVITASFYMGLGKRRNELGKSGNQINTRKVLKYYNYAFLDKNMYMCLGLTNAFYALWVIGTQKEVMIWTVPMVMVLGMKYSLNIERDSDGDPVEVILQDKILWLLGILYSALVIGAIYLV